MRRIRYTHIRRIGFVDDRKVRTCQGCGEASSFAKVRVCLTHEIEETQTQRLFCQNCYRDLADPKSGEAPRDGSLSPGKEG